MESLNKIEGKQSHWHNSLHPITNIFFFPVRLNSVKTFLLIKNSQSSSAYMFNHKLERIYHFGSWHFSCKNQFICLSSSTLQW